MLQSLEVLNTTLGNISKDLLVRPKLQDVTALLEKKVNAEDLKTEMTQVISALNQFSSDLHRHDDRFEEQ